MMAATLTRLRPVLLILMLGAAVMLAAPAPAAAHAQLLETTPAEGEVVPEAPAHVELRFNEPVTLVEDSVRLFSEGADPVTLEATVTGTTLRAALPDRGAGLADGGHSISYRVISADTHPVGGVVTFTVGTGSAAPAPTPAATAEATGYSAVSGVTALQYLGLLLFTGLVLFRVLVLGSRAETTSLARGLRRGAGLMAVVATLLLIPATALRTIGSGFDALPEVSGWWSAVTATLILSAVLVAAAVILAEAGLVGRPARWRCGLAVGAAMVGLSVPVLTGHTRVMEPRVVILAADLGHLWSGAVWIGGIVGLLMILNRTCRSDGTDVADTARLVARFSRLAAGSVIVLLLSGATMATVILDSPGDLTGSAWGRVLLLKVALLLPVLGAAAYNRRVMVPELEMHERARPRWRLLHRTLTVEAGLVTAIILTSGFLTNLQPHSTGAATVQDTAAGPVEFSGQGQELTVTGELTPGVAGGNTMTFRLEYQGQAVTPEQVTVSAAQPELELGPIQLDPVVDPTTGEYRTTATLPASGEWSFRVSARVDTFTEPLVALVVTVD